jgi:hypothetical protein
MKIKIKVVGWCTQTPQNFKAGSLVEGGTRQGWLEGCYQGGQGSQRAIEPDEEEEEKKMPTSALCDLTTVCFISI